RRALLGFQGPGPRVPGLRGRLSLARAVRSDGRTCARPGRAAAVAAVEVPPLARARGRAPAEEAVVARRGGATARRPRAPGTHPRPHSETDRLVPPPPPGDAARRRGARDRRAGGR